MTRPDLHDLARLTLAQAGELVGRNASSLRQAILRGSLKAEKIGRDWFVKPADLKRYIKGAEKKR